MTKKILPIIICLVAVACSPITTPTPPQGYIEKEAREIEFTNAEIAYIGDDMGDEISDRWMLTLHSAMELDSEGNPIGPGSRVQILLNAPYNAKQEPNTSLLGGIYAAQNSSGNFSPGTFVNGYTHSVELPGKRVEVVEATFWAEVAGGTSEMDIDLVDDGVVQIGGSGDHFTIEGILVGHKCLKHNFFWSGKLEPTLYEESSVPNSTLANNLELTTLSKALIEDRGDYFGLKDRSYRSLLIFLTEEGVNIELGKPQGTGELLRIELLVPWEWDITQGGIPQGIYPMLTRNADTSIDRDAITPYHAIPGLPNRFSHPYWAGCWYVEMASGEWSERYARIDGGEVVVEHTASGTKIHCTLKDSSAAAHTITATVEVATFTIL